MRVRAARDKLSTADNAEAWLCTVALNVARSEPVSPDGASWTRLTIPSQ